MSPTSTALIARARGLATHLFGRPSLLAALEAPDLEALARRLEERGVPPTPRPVTAAELEVAVRRWAGRELARLARWLPPGDALADAIFGEEDRRSVRAMLRGAAAGVPADRRLAGLIPTPRLQERALAELSRQPGAAQVAALLVTWRHPLGSPLLAATAGAEPDLAEVERVLLSATLDTLHRAARRWGSGLRHWARETVDLANARTAIAMAAREEEHEPERAFVSCGSVPLTDLAHVAAADSPADAASRAAAVLPPGPIADAFRRRATSLALLDDALLAAQVAERRAKVRLDPLGPDTVLLYALRLRAQVMLLRQAIWRLTLGIHAPADNPLLEAAS